MEMLPESAYVFRDRELMNPQVNDFFRTLEFKSLITEEAVEMKSFESLGIELIPVETSEELMQIKNELAQTMKCAIGTVTHENRLTGLAIGIGERWYLLDFSKYSGTEFLEWLLRSDLEIIGYDIKEELKFLRGYLKNSSQL